MEEVLEFLLLFFKISFSPIGAFVICGLIVALCERIVMYFCGRGGRGIILATSIIGTPVHEIGHASMCVVFGHKIKKMRLWCPKSRDGTLGYVEHSYNRKNLYQRFGNMFIGMGPIFSGLLFIFLVMLICFGDAFDTYVISVFRDGYEVSSIGELFSDGFYMIKDMFSDSTRHVAVKVIGFILILSTCLHINLSTPDIKNSLSALPIYLAITFVLSILVYFIDGAFGYAVVIGLSSWLSVGITLYLPVLAAAVCILAISFAFYLVRLIFRK